jgi:adenine-specific DNA-methyltransferase
MILGDSLLVMTSLAEKEGLKGKVQMIYMDPPYGIRFASNFQPEIGKRDVKDKEADLTREPEMVKAYRDTWTLGVQSYLSYLRDRLLLCKELLTEEEDDLWDRKGIFGMLLKSRGLPSHPQDRFQAAGRG